LEVSKKVRSEKPKRGGGGSTICSDAIKHEIKTRRHAQRGVKSKFMGERGICNKREFHASPHGKGRRGS